MSEENKTIRCPKCDMENNTDDKFCKECGAEMQNSTLENLNATINTNMYKLKTLMSFFSGIILFFSRLFIYGILPIGLIYFAIRIYLDEFRHSFQNAETIFQQISISIQEVHYTTLAIMAIVGIIYIFTVIFVNTAKNDVIDKLKEIEYKVDSISKKGN